MDHNGQSEDSSANAGNSLPRRDRNALWVYLMVLVSIFVVEWGPILFGMLRHHGAQPVLSPLVDPAGRFGDWTYFTLRTHHFGEPGMLSRTDLGPPYTYPLPSIFIFVVFNRLFHDTLPAYVVCAFSIFLVATAIFSVGLRRRHAGTLVQAVVWSTLLLGSPALFLIDRGNVEVFLWLLMLAGSVLFVRRRPYAAAAFFALAASMKLYPAVLLLLLLRRRQYKAFCFGVALAVGITLLALEVVGPTIPGALHDLSAGARVLRDENVVALAEGALRFDHSLFGFAKQALFTLMKVRHQAGTAPPRFPVLASVYGVVAPVLFVAIYWFRVRLLPLLNQFVALMVLALLLPFVSYDYTLVHLYLCLGAFLLFLLEQRGADAPSLPPWAGMTAMLAFAVLFAPLARLAGQHFQGQAKCLALLVLLGVSVAKPLPSRLFGDALPSAG